METSDSDCFESADEDISEESSPRAGPHKTSSNINSLNVREDQISNNRTVCLEENKLLNDHVEEDITENNIITNCLTKDNNNSLQFRQNIELDTADTSNLLKQDNEEIVDTKFSSDVSAWENKQWDKTDHITVKDTKKQLSEASVEEVNTNKNLLTKEDGSNNLKKERLLENEDIWEDDWSNEAEIDIYAKKSLLTKENNYCNIKEESTLEEDKNKWDGGGPKDKTEIDTKTNLLTKENNLLEDSKDIWEDDWGQWESVSNEESTSNKTTESILTSNESKLNSGSWGDWGSWGVTSLLSTASSSVSTITNQVTQGISNVLESGIGIPDPEELAKMNKEEKESSNENITDNFKNETVPAVVDNQCQPRAFNFETLLTGVTQITKLVESTSNKVISGGLDTLETIGKKTMEVLQEGDPGLKKKRAFLRMDSEKLNLSQVLREAKEKSQEENKEKKPNRKYVNYETLFDDHHGLVHLEALEMLSKQCNIKLRSVFESSSSEDLVELQETIDQIQELCELPEDDDEQLHAEEVVQKLKECISELGILISYDKLISVWKDAEIWMKNTSNLSCKDIHEKAINTLAQVTVLAVEQFHKSAELLLTKQHRSTADEADSLVQITIILTSFVGYIASEFCKAMTKDQMDNIDVKNQITNVYFEAANSSSYIKDAFKLLIPVIEVGTL
ncbi:protein FAM114A2 [Agrilus planipennis]|uniref:Protein FAM114A2 n=1 Tax=Agrilus planipennis TaxID=224129 RepID=A0A1W4X531_AGRPL|nr:protein FAM114A2 [Agrilus planipennis]